MKSITGLAGFALLLLLLPHNAMTQYDLGSTEGVTLGEDSSITVTGRAWDAKWGAIVLAGWETPFYVDQLGYWEDDYYGKSVRVSGRLVVEMHEAGSTETGEGLQVQTMEGRQYIIRDAVWELAE